MHPHTLQIFICLCLHRTLAPALAHAFEKRQLALTAGLAVQHHSSFYAAFCAMLSSHNTQGKKRKKIKPHKPQHLSHTESILFLAIKVPYVFVHHQVHELLYMKAGLEFLICPAQRVMRSEVILGWCAGKSCLIPCFAVVTVRLFVPELTAAVLTQMHITKCL